MHFEHHCQRTLEKYGSRCEEVHIYLDQYFKYFRNEAHRLILHHSKGAGKVAHKYRDLYGFDLAYEAARLHIEDDMGAMVNDWNALAPHLFFLCDKEVDDATHFLQLEFPLYDFSDLKSNIYY